MGLLFESVTMTQELKKNILIRQLRDMGIIEHKNKSLYDLNYYELVHLKATSQNTDSDENKWF